MIRIWTAAAIVAALLLVLMGRVIPLPALVTGEEGSRTDLVAARTEAITARYQFQQAELDYERFLTAPLSNLPDELRKEADDLDAGGDRKTIMEQAHTRVARMIDLGKAMFPYAESGDQFFVKLLRYDDALMSWTRSLGARSEQLRASTWPILEWLKRYPKPVGLDTEFIFAPAASDSPIMKYIAGGPVIPGIASAPPPISTTLSTLEQLAPQLDASGADSATLRRIALIGDQLWADGKNLPSVDRYHDGYFSALRRYDAESVEVAVSPEPALGNTQAILAWGGAVGLGGLLLLALLLLLAPPAFWRRFRLLRAVAAEAPV